ncbi:hypothetical protein FS749_001732 [Ceratobasidium sp. UAMH 11750]|nr:hypothetical protein FS749_001732 [Ceratobasidium sp. UAMH 11750]
MNFTDSFVADGCKNGSGVPAVTLGAAEQWRDVYKAADGHNVTVVGGAANSVGAAGGWLQGGGHSPLGSLYGMGVDNALQLTVVKADGQIVRANACQNKDLFWGMRGGGGSTYGVALDVTYKTHPALESIVFLALTVNVTSPPKLTELTETFFRTVPNITDHGVRGYAYWPSPVSFTFTAIHPNGPDVAATNATFRSIFDWVSNNPGTQLWSNGAVHSTFYDLFATWFRDESSLATPAWIGGRLVSRSALEKNSARLAGLAVNPSVYVGSIVNIIGGGIIDKIDPESTGLNPQWRKEALISWNPATAWTDDTPELGKVAGLDHAAYFNEADPGEPQWKKAFFGKHYDRLLKIKRQMDPKGVFWCNRCHDIVDLVVAPAPVFGDLNDVGNMAN